jgi:hypothetical protein
MTNNVFGEDRNYFQPVADWTEVYNAWQFEAIQKQIMAKIAA